MCQFNVPTSADATSSAREATQWEGLPAFQVTPRLIGDRGSNGSSVAALAGLWTQANFRPFCGARYAVSYLLCRVPRLLHGAYAAAAFLFRRTILRISSTLRARNCRILRCLLVFEGNEATQNCCTSNKTCALNKKKKMFCLFSRFWGAFIALLLISCYSATCGYGRSLKYLEPHTMQDCWLEIRRSAISTTQ